MSKCRICKSDKLIEVLNLGNQYLSEFRDDDKKSPSYPLVLVMCEKCKQVQLRSTVPQNVLYTDNYGYRSGINMTMRKHLADLVQEAIDTVGDNLNKDDVVIDIGSNDATLLKAYPESLKRFGFDLVPKFAQEYKGSNIIFVNEPFGFRSIYPKARIITAISMFYDLDNPIDVMNSMADALDEKGIIVIQQNYLLSMLKNNAFDNILAEHLCYHSLTSMNLVAQKCGLEIFKVSENDLNGGSFRTYLCRRGDYKINDSVDEFIRNELNYGINDQETYRDFSKRVFNIARDINHLLIELNVKNKTVFCLSASTRGNTLLQTCGLSNKLVQKSVERNKEKFGKKIASLGIPIISEEEMWQNPPDAMLVLNWYFRQEMNKRYEAFVNNGGKLIYPLPKLEIVG